MKKIAKIISLIATLLYTGNVLGQMTFVENFTLDSEIQLNIIPKFQKYLNYYPQWVNSKRKITDVRNGQWLIKGYREGIDTIDFSSMDGRQWTRFIVTYSPAIKKEIDIINASDTINLNINEEKFVAANILTYPNSLLIKWIIRDSSIVSIKNTLVPLQIYVRGKKAGTTILYAVKPNGNPGPGPGPMPNRPGENEIFDSCVIIVGKLPICKDEETGSETISFCNNQSVTIRSNAGIVNWYNDPELEHQIGSDSVLLQQLATTNIDLYLTQNKATCQSIIKHITIKPLDKPIISGIETNKIDTVCLKDKIGVLTQFTNVTILSANNTLIRDTIFTKAGLQTMYLQRGVACKSDLTKWTVYVRDCSHDFVAQYHITGRIHASGIDSASVFLIDKSVSDRYIDSCKLNIRDSFKLRVPKMGSYTVLVEPLSERYYATFYGNKSTERRASFITISNDLPLQSYIEKLDIYLLKSDNTDINETEANTYSIKCLNNILDITRNDDKSFSIQLFSIDGRLQSSTAQISGNVKIELSKFASEIIIAQILCEDETTIEKCIIR